ncbi:MAG: Kae1-associated serine/threonine protein kinase [Candidatus Aenigmarchaeota archaeon]|nr:Kae1-associated serine/threonine protein kinase [Candidatus Aenigmarchaeota archaeon]
MPEIRRGAEAVVTLEDDQVVKNRIVKAYRLPELDQRLRKKRTSTESSILRQARRVGVPVPSIISESESTIVMERIRGKTVKEALTKTTLQKLCIQIGSSIATLHRFGIIHGDLTTSNMIVSEDRVVFIDFGLSYHSIKPEDRATDLYALRQTLASTHAELADEAWKCITETYQTAAEDADKVIKTLRKIEQRRRYTLKSD